MGTLILHLPVKLKSLKALHFYSEARIGMPLDEVFFSDGYKNHANDTRNFQLYDTLSDCLSSLHGLSHG
jgi:hypothetical protein